MNFLGCRCNSGQFVNKLLTVLIKVNMLNENQPPDSLPVSDQTIMIPAPGGRHIATSPKTTAPVPVLHGAGLNPLVRAASPLLDLVGSLRLMTSYTDIEQLRTQLATSVKQFEAAAKAALLPNDSIAVARYCLCTLLDESIASTPWGGSGVWAKRSLLVTFHNEASGGEKFFLLLQKMGEDVATNLFTLELMYLCLALGLEGRYRLIENGRSQLDELRERLVQVIQKQRADTESELSLHWRSAAAKGESLWRVVPIWVLALATVMILIALKLVLSSLLNQAAEPVDTAMHNIKVAQPIEALLPTSVTPPLHIDRVGSFLEPEVARHLVTVTESVDRSVITLIGDRVFASGSAKVNPEFVPLLQRIADAIKPLDGQVLIIGHTDNVKSGRSSRYPSNWDLSMGRANSVKTLLAAVAGPEDRYRVEGRGDTDPLVPNDSAEHRARNRRVDIIVTMPRLP